MRGALPKMTMPYVFILDEHQKSTDQPTQKISKSIARRLVRRMLAKEIKKGLYQRLPVKFAAVKAQEVMKSIPAPSKYIPVELPRPEVSGLRFEDPDNAKSTQATRRFRLMQAREFAVVAGVKV